MGHERIPLGRYSSAFIMCTVKCGLQKQFFKRDLAFNSWRSQTVGQCTLSLERGNSFHAYEGVRSGIVRMEAKGGFVSETLPSRSEMYRKWET